MAARDLAVHRESYARENSTFKAFDKHPGPIATRVFRREQPEARPVVIGLGCYDDFTRSSARFNRRMLTRGSPISPKMRPSIEELTS